MKYTYYALLFFFMHLNAAETPSTLLKKRIEQSYKTADQLGEAAEKCQAGHKESILAAQLLQQDAEGMIRVSKEPDSLPFSFLESFRTMGHALYWILANR